MTAFAFWKTDGERNPGIFLHYKPKPHLELDGQKYFRIRQNTVPHGVAKVPFVIHDMECSVELHTEVIAGSVGMSILDESPKTFTVQPKSGRWMFLIKQKDTNNGREKVIEKGSEPVHP